MPAFAVEPHGPLLAVVCDRLNGAILLLDFVSVLTEGDEDVLDRLLLEQCKVLRACKVMRPDTGPADALVIASYAQDSFVLDSFLGVALLEGNGHELAFASLVVYEEARGLELVDIVIVIDFF